MKIGKYPVKHSYKIPRLISDVFSAGLALYVVSSELVFLADYDERMKRYIGEEQLRQLMQYDSSLVWKRYIMLIFPVLVVGVFAAYLILALKSHKFPKLEITKRNAQKIRDYYALCVSLCKIPALLLINELMMITLNNNFLMAGEPWISVQLVVDLLIIALLIMYFYRLISRAASPEAQPAGNTDTIKIKSVVKEQSAEDSAESDAERS